MLLLLPYVESFYYACTHVFDRQTKKPASRIFVMIARARRRFTNTREGQELMGNVQNFLFCVFSRLLCLFCVGSELRC